MKVKAIIGGVAFLMVGVGFIWKNTSSPEAKVKGKPELGAVEWHEKFEKARKIAKENDQLLLVLFTEVPGCSTVKAYGRKVLSNPHVANAIEKLFVPVVVYNNKTGRHREVLKSFNEPTWNNPAVRIIEPDRSMAAPRLYGDYSVSATVQTMVEALKTTDRSVPSYLRLMNRQWQTTAKDTAIFGMYCYWSGEAGIGQFSSVLSTKPGYIENSEAVQVIFDANRTSLADLAQKINNADAADQFYTSDRTKLAKVEHIFGKAAHYTNEAFRYNKDADNYRLQNSSLSNLDLTELQQTRINSAIGLGHDPYQYLFPAQKNQVE